MDRNHTMEAPNNDELKDIEQISDRSDLTNIYREPGDQYEGELLSKEDRVKAKADELEAITSGLGKHAFKIGLFVPLPFITGLLIGSGLYSYASQLEEKDTMFFVFFSVFAIAAWMITSYMAYAAIFKIFYKHALRAGPFLVVMLVSIMMASQAIFWIVSESYATQSLVFNAALMSLLLLMYSLVANFILVGIWGNSRMQSGIKAIVSLLIIVISGAFVAATYLL